MHIDILSAVPALLQSPFQHSILQRAEEKGLLKVDVHDIRKWGIGKARQIDDYQYGGGAGMVMLNTLKSNLCCPLSCSLLLK